VKDTFSFQRTYPISIIYIVFHSEDIGRYICLWVAQSSKKVVWGSQFLGGKDTQILGMPFQIALTSKRVAGFR